MHISYQVLILAPLHLHILSHEEAASEVQRIAGRQHGHQLLLLTQVVKHRNLCTLRGAELLPLRPVAHCNGDRSLQQQVWGGI